MTHIKSILTAAALCAVAATGLQAQSTNPASAYNAPGLPIREAVANALALKDDATRQGVDRGLALAFALGDKARDAAVKELAPGIAERVLAGDELSGVEGVPPQLVGVAHAFKARQLPTGAAQFEYLANILEAPGTDYIAMQAASQQLALSGLRHAAQLIAARKLADAESVLTKLLPHKPADVIPPLADVKTRLGKHAEAQGLALVGWRISGYKASPTAEAVLFAAIAADPGKGLGAANAVRKFINDGAGANPLAAIAAPVIALKKVHSDAEEFTALTLAGKLDAALAKANFIFAQASQTLKPGEKAEDNKAVLFATDTVLAAERNKNATNAGATEAKRAWLKNGGIAQKSAK